MYLSKQNKVAINCFYSSPFNDDSHLIINFKLLLSIIMKITELTLALNFHLQTWYTYLLRFIFYSYCLLKPGYYEPLENWLQKFSRASLFGNNLTYTRKRAFMSHTVLIETAGGLIVPFYCFIKPHLYKLN